MKQHSDGSKSDGSKSDGSKSSTVLPSVQPGSIAGYLQVLGVRWYLVIGTAVVVVATALTLSITSTKQYDASAKVLILQADPVDNLLNPGSAQVIDPQRNVETSAELIKLDSVASRVRRSLDLQLSAQELLSKVSTEIASTSNLVSVIARDPSPRAAAQIANGFATQYAVFRRRSDQANLNQAANIARSQLAALSPSELASAQGQQLAARLQELHLAASSQTGGVEVVSRATVPDTPSRPRIWLSAIVSSLLGLALGVIAALLFDFANPRLRRAEAVKYPEAVKQVEAVEDK
jgi:capsular polysaccharide biosynthesis protein